MLSETTAESGPNFAIEINFFIIMTYFENREAQ